MSLPKNPFQNYDSIVVSGCVARDQLMSTKSTFNNNLNTNFIFNVTFQANQMETRFGGNATNLAYGFTFFTQKPISILASVGKDGADFIDFFKSKNIFTDGIFADNDLYTATANCLTDADGSQVWGFYHGASVKSVEIDFKKYVSPKALVILGADDDIVFIMRQKQCKENKVDYVYDCGMMLADRVDVNDLKDGILNSKFLVINEYELELIKKKVMLTKRDILKAGVVLIITKGAEGVQYLTEFSDIFVPSYPTKCIDPVGAGDSWRGGFFGSLIQGRSIIESLVWGNVLASFCVESIGGCGYTPTEKQLTDRFYKVKELYECQSNFY
jgi:adenosine kinase